MEPDELLERLREAPERAAIVLDVDGVLAPIVDRPEDARVPDETREELRRLNDKYALVACVSGRAGDDARRIVGLDELVYVGEHGLELDPEAPAWSSRLREFAESVAWPVEDKGLTLSFHYRTAEDPEAAETYLLEVASRRARRGPRAALRPDGARVRPPLETNKGTAVRHLSGPAGSSARSTRATTRPTSTHFTRSTRSSGACASAWCLTRAPAGSRRARTSWWARRPSCSSSYGVSDLRRRAHQSPNARRERCERHDQHGAEARRGRLVVEGACDRTRLTLDRDRHAPIEHVVRLFRSVSHLRRRDRAHPVDPMVVPFVGATVRDLHPTGLRLRVGLGGEVDPAEALLVQIRGRRARVAKHTDLREPKVRLAFVAEHRRLALRGQAQAVVALEHEAVSPSAGVTAVTSDR